MSQHSHSSLYPLPRGLSTRGAFRPEGYVGTRGRPSGLRLQLPLRADVPETPCLLLIRSQSPASRYSEVFPASWEPGWVLWEGGKAKGRDSSGKARGGITMGLPPGSWSGAASG